MSDANPNSIPPRPTSSPTRILAIVLPIAIVGLAAYWWSTRLEARARNDMSTDIIQRMFTSEPLLPASGMAFADADGDMVADPPKDPAKLIKPDTLVFSYVA